MESLPFNKVFETPFFLNVGLGEVNMQVSMDARKDGRIMGLIVEKLIAPAMAEYGYSYAPAAEYDYKSVNTTFNLECKGANHRGANLSPSNMQGKGRYYDHNIFVESAKSKHFVIVDASLAGEGKLRYMFLEGAEVAKMDEKKKGKLKATEVAALFENAAKTN